MYSKLKKMASYVSPKMTQKSAKPFSSLAHLTDLTYIDNRQLALTIISSILSDLIYIDCDIIFNKPILVSLGLTVRECYISENTTKFMVFTKTTPDEQQQLQTLIMDDTRDLQDIEKLKGVYQTEINNDNYDNLDSIINSSKIKRTIKFNEVTKSFIKPNYSPKFNHIISSLLFNNLSNLARYIQNDDIFVVFRGTITGQNIYTDLQFPLVSTNITNNIGKLHSGFLKAYKTIQGKLEVALRKYNNWTNMIYTGHSLGAALASIATMHYTKKYRGHNRYNIGLITFGSPRVTDIEASEYFTQLLLRDNS
jgi:hypothetical protein